jgi:4-amino-4-deoxy-L-arabinose transferase-like glycosyltransferase
MFKNKKNFIIVLILTLIGAFLHFYNINWGAPFYFHPDERNIASAVAQLQFPHHMNPQFFAYGSLPIYAIYFTGFLTNYIISYLTPGPAILNPNFTQAILISRIYSSLFATFLIPLLYVIAKKLTSKQSQSSAGLLAAFFATATTGLIQFAHFGTFEMWLTFFTTLLFWSCLHVLEEKKLDHIILLSLIFGILVSVKVSSLALLPIPLFVLAIQTFRNNRKNQETEKFRHPKMLSILHFLRNICLFIFITTLIFIITNPYAILASQDFLSSMHYESGVALGTEPVFYTGNFANTIPGIYQLLHVYPFLINPLMTVLFIPAFCYVCYRAIKKRNPSYQLLAIFFLFLFISQAFLFVKWTRYMMPTLPFIMLTIALALTKLTQANKHLARLLAIEITILIILNSLVAFSYFKTAFVDLDTRISAAIRVQEAIPTKAHILIEPADLGALPFQDAFPHIDNFNFYELDNNSSDAKEMQLQQKIADSQYIILPSQRILQSRLANPAKFPKGYVFYKTLLNGNLGYKKIYETPCDVFCTIAYLGDPVYWWEQTASVFDRPTVMIFKKAQ